MDTVTDVCSGSLFLAFRKTLHDSLEALKKLQTWNSNIAPIVYPFQITKRKAINVSYLTESESKAK